MKHKKFIIAIGFMVMSLFACKSNDVQLTYENTESASHSINQETKNKEEVLVPEGDLYESEKLGFSFIVPEGWRDRYRIEEAEDSLWIYFTPYELEEEGEGILLIILDSELLKDGEEYIIDDISVFEVNGRVFIAGGTTDIGFSEHHKEFNDYIQMRQECVKLLETIKPIED